MKDALVPFFAAFWVAVVAELPCLCRAAALAASDGRFRAVALGTLAGQVLVLLPLLLWGEALARALPPAWETGLRFGAGLFFLLLGAWLTVRSTAG